MFVLALLHNAVTIFDPKDYNADTQPYPAHPGAGGDGPQGVEVLAAP